MARPRKWIQGAHIKKGALHRDLGLEPGVKIPLETLRWAAKQPGALGRRGRMALNLRKVTKGAKSKYKKNVKQKKLLQKASQVIQDQIWIASSQAWQIAQESKQEQKEQAQEQQRSILDV